MSTTRKTRASSKGRTATTLVYEPQSPAMTIDANDDKFSDQGTELVGSSLQTVQKEWNKNAGEYIRNCKKFDLFVDPNVVIALQTGWDKMQPSKKFGEGELLSLIDVLDKNDHIKKLNLASITMHDSRFRAGGNGNSNARVLNFILQHNTSLESLDLSNTGLDDDGMNEICEGLKMNTSITNLNLAANHFGEAGAKALLKALDNNATIKQLDLSRNALGFHSINALLCSCKPKGIFVYTNGNYVFEEILNAVSHGVAFIVSIVAANVLVRDAAAITTSDTPFWACVIYSFSLMFLFLSSCLFHSFFMSPNASRILQVLDHVGIYMLIAGSYTPYLLIALPSSTAARVLVSAEWIFALFGSIFAACSDLNHPTTTVVELSAFIIMGCGVFLVWSELVAELAWPGVNLLLIGGAVYLIGVVFFILAEYKPIYHAIWHLFVVLAATLHWFAIYLFVLRTDIGEAAIKATSAYAEQYGVDLHLSQAINK